VLVMRRFPAGAELAVVAGRGGLTDALAECIGREVARFHMACPVRDADGADLIADILDELGREFAGLADLLGPDAVTFPPRAREVLAVHAPLLRERAVEGLVRRAHGDLHLRNLVMLEGRPVPFDALEFDERLGTCDVLYDLAFLLMDMRHRGHRRAACLTMNAWLAAFAPPQEAGLAAMPVFLALRAAIRAMVEAQAARVADHPAEHAAEARRYLADALAYLEPAPPRLVALGGFSGAGKSTLARAVAHGIGPPPGAVLLRSDVIRKALAGVEPEARLPPEAYTADAAARVYAEMRTRAAAALGAGRAVILDAVHGRAEEGRAAEAVAAAAGVPFDGVWIEAPEASLRARVEARRPDASDADAEVLRAQLRGLRAPDWPHLPNAGTEEDGAAALARALSLGD
jgi:predicted kinase